MRDRDSEPREHGVKASYRGERQQTQSEGSRPYLLRAEGAPPPLSEQEWLHALTVLDPRPSAERPAVLDPSI